MIVRLKVTLVINEDDFYNGFNSMIVRLKESQQKLWGLIQTFQFYDSPIKSPLSMILPIIISCFNSMIVRLKVSGGFSSSRLVFHVSIL